MRLYTEIGTQELKTALKNKVGCYWFYAKRGLKNGIYAKKAKCFVRL